MASGDLQDEQNQDRPKQPNEQARLATALAALSARVESLEQQLAELLRFATALFGLAALGLSAIFAHGPIRYSDQQNKAFPSWLTIVGSAIVAFNFIAILACLRELDSAWRVTVGNPEADLSQGYRVLSFLGLGALLMAISFAYQNDWLALRLPNPTPESHLPNQEGSDQ